MSTRFIGLDVHKHYLLAIGVNSDKEPIYDPKKVSMTRLEEWAHRALTPEDSLVLEMTTNTWEIYDTLLPYVASITIVHPPHVSLITRAMVKTDQKAALTLAQLHAAGLLPAVWVPDERTRELRALTAKRSRFVSMSSMAKNRLHAVLHRHRLLPEDLNGVFSEKNQGWWLSLPVSMLEKVRIQTDLDTIAFAQQQIERIEACLAEFAATDKRIPLLTQVTGIGMVNALTILGAIGTIERFEQARDLVGYAGLGTKVHISGQTHYSGRITKTGRKDLRYVMVEVAMHAVRSDPHWQRVYQSMLKRGKNEHVARVAVARKMLVNIWYILTESKADPFAEPGRVAASLHSLAYKVGVKNLPKDQSAASYVRYHLDQMGIGQELTHIPWGSKKVKLPPSRLAKLDNR